MKIVAVVVLSLLHLIAGAVQTPEQRAEAVADEFCQCVNSTYIDIDEDVKKAMGRMVSYQLQNQPKDLERYMNRLSDELVIRIEEQAGHFKKNGALAQICIHDMEKAMETVNLEDQQYDGLTEDRFSRLIQQQLNGNTGCEFAALLLKLGLHENTKRSQVHIGQVYSRKTVGKRSRLSTSPRG